MRLKKLMISLFFSLLLTPLSALADIDLTEIITILGRIEGLNTNIKDLNTDIKTYTKGQLDALTSHNTYGTDGFQNVQSWGKDADDWKNALELYKKGAGGGELAITASQLNNDFPINPDLKTVQPKDIRNKYDELQAKTALASRSASQLAFNKIKAQMDYLEELRKKIDGTKDLKASVDLQNRLIYESNLLQLELLKLAALSNQQQAIEAQSNVNQAVINKAFNAY